MGAPAGTLPNDMVGGSIGHAQYIQWRGNFGNSLAGSGVAVPEPTSITLAMLAVLGFTGFLVSPKNQGRSITRSHRCGTSR